jgi:hypothetical protein
MQQQIRKSSSLSDFSLTGEEAEDLLAVGLGKPLDSHDFDHSLGIVQDASLVAQEEHLDVEVPPDALEEVVGILRNFPEGEDHSHFLAEEGHIEGSLEEDHSVHVEGILVVPRVEERNPLVVLGEVSILNQQAVVGLAESSQGNGREDILGSRYVEPILVGSPEEAEVDRENQQEVDGHGRVSLNLHVVPEHLDVAGVDPLVADAETVMVLLNPDAVEMEHLPDEVEAKALKNAKSAVEMLLEVDHSVDAVGLVVQILKLKPEGYEIEEELEGLKQEIGKSVGRWLAVEDAWSSWHLEVDPEDLLEQGWMYDQKLVLLKLEAVKQVDSCLAEEE